MTVQEALEQLRDVVGPRIKEIMPPDVSIQYRGTADRLEAALSTMTTNLAVAAFVLFLILAAMFRSLWDALLVLLSMPLAVAGGILALRVMNLITSQAMDLLTTIGFVILLGLVVNNAILLIMQTRTGQRNGLERSDAVAQAVRIRARPIYMSTLTSIFGMLPLMLIPGVGSQIYRGLATVIVGGMIVSAIFTLVLMPSVLRLPRVQKRPRLAAHGLRPDGVARGLVISLLGFLENRVIQRLLGDQLLQTGVLTFQVLELLCLRDLHAAVLLAPAIIVVLLDSSETLSHQVESF